MSSVTRVATDVGGTFTDLVALHIDGDGKQRITIGKGDTTPPNFEQGVLNVVAQSGVSPKEIAFFAHGTTVAINALTERKGVRTALITTKGFRDSIEIARGDRPDFFNLDYQKPKPFVERYLRREVGGRVDADGKEISALDLADLEESLNIFRKESVEAIAICLLNAYVNPEHEVQVVNAIKKLWPEVCVVASHHLTREWREYERSNTTVLSAFIKPVVEKYLGRLSSGLNEKGFEGNLFVMQSNCGVDTVQGVSAAPITIVESGPASGMWGAAALGRLIGSPNVLALDIGGTTAKCALVVDGNVRTKTDYSIERNEKSAGYPLIVPVVDLVEIGNGGGSIAWVDDFNRLHVGPQSAGALPGPASYGQGGTKPTTTDANLALGTINPDFFCGGTRKADVGAMTSAIDTVAQNLGISRQEAAVSIIEVANHNMLNALKLVSVNRGHDPREFTLVAFGGGGGLHACSLAVELGIHKVVMPASAGVFSAWGMLLSDLRRDFVQTTNIALDSDGAAQRLEDSMRAVESSLSSQFSEEKIQADQLKFTRFARLRYQDQGHTVEIPIAGKVDLEEISADFATAYKKEYTYKLEIGVVLESLRVSASAEVGKINLAAAPTTGRALKDCVKSTRQVHMLAFGTHEATVYDGTKLEPGMSFTGPAILENETDTVVVLPGMPVSVDEYANVHINTAVHTKVQDVAKIKGENTKVTKEIIQKAVASSADEMFAAYRRSAFTPVIYEVLDLATAITDANGELAGAGAGIPAFFGMLDKSVMRILSKYTKEKVYPGDIFMVNDPYNGGVTHNNDCVFALPIFDDETKKLVAWAVNIAHFMDLGGMTFSSMSPEATECFQEGIAIPPIKIFNKGEFNQDVFDLLMNNTRTPTNLEGDFWAGIASVRVGERNIKNILAKYGLETVVESLAEYLEYGEKVSLAALKTLPHGSFKLDEPQDDGTTMKIVVTVDPTQFHVDLTGMPDQCAGPFNISNDAAVTVAQVVFKSLTARFSRICNGGTFRNVKVTTKSGTICDPARPAPMCMYYETLIRVTDCILRCISEQVPDFCPAGTFATIAGTLMSGKHPTNPRLNFTVLEPLIGGWGGAKTHDGNSTVFSTIHGDTMNCPAEVTEARNGIVVEQMAINTADEGGAGKFRGGQGLRMSYRVLAPGNATAAYTRNKILPWPLKGGSEGSPNYVEITRAATGEVERHAVVSTDLAENDVLTAVTATGAGWGNPNDRDPAQIASDIKNGYITAAAAEKFYGYKA